ncbi:Undecaprenyl-phosphate mannosyltransferase [Maioricimonas rarisocia]|uniref:Undecaprenyl-phosphate mannosyltransferase n=1 Tax=Maioricimonas rarisocia TaxID=2528026 RepID=A0A517ZCS8_9PLAN|nr:polyprenol monophosphomannose synthase [Maioricimonas rarisocia]QDU40267.1 Undecaprenyl-phosphate mannosyltransferase [Maioricimonas rarisocia]
MSDASRLLITLCTFNERDNIRNLIPEILEHAPQADVLVVDDNSPDGTGELAEQMGQDDPRILTMRRVGQRGLGSATVAAFRYACEHDYDWVINLDADFSHPPRYIPDLLARRDEADIVIGSRYISGGRIVGWQIRRHLMSRCINIYARLMLGLRTKDNSGSYRLYRASQLKKIDFDGIRSTGYAFQEEILFRCRQVGCTFAEVPITFEERRYGVTKINLREAVIAVYVLGTLRFWPE